MYNKKQITINFYLIKDRSDYTPELDERIIDMDDQTDMYNPFYNKNFVKTSIMSVDAIPDVDKYILQWFIATGHFPNGRQHIGCFQRQPIMRQIADDVWLEFKPMVQSVLIDQSFADIVSLITSHPESYWVGNDQYKNVFCQIISDAFEFRVTISVNMKTMNTFISFLDYALFAV